MRKRSIAGVLSVVAVATALAWLLGAPRERPGSAVVGAPTTPAPRPLRVDAFTAPLPPAKGARAIRGSVRGPSAPVAGAIVVAFAERGEDVLSDIACPCAEQSAEKILECSCEEAGSQVTDWVLERRGEAPPIARAVAAADGTFALAGLEEGLYALWAEKPGELVGVRRSVHAGDDGVEIALDEGMRIRGKALGDNLRPARDALVTAIYQEHSRFFDARPGTDGAFAIGPVPVGRFTVVASAPGLLPARARGRPGEPEAGNLVLSSPRRIAGTVSRAGKPTRAKIEVEGGRRKARCETDQAGHFVLDALPPGAYAVAAAQGLAQARAHVRIEPGKDPPELALSLEDGGEIVGVVRSEAEVPLRDVQVVAVATGAKVQQHSGADGRFRLCPLPPGVYELRFEASGYFPGSQTAQVEAGKTASVELVLQEGSRLTGVVVDEAGRPVEGARLDANLAQPPEEDACAAEGRTRSKPDGTFVLAGLCAAPYELAVRHDDYRSHGANVEAPQDGVRVVLAKGLELSGTVVDEGGRPVAGAQVIVAVKSAPSGARGEFTIRGLKPGRQAVLASLRTDSGERSAGTLVELPAEAPVRLQFEAGAPISGKVVDAQGQPVAGALVILFPVEPPGPRTGPSCSHSAPPGTQYARTDADGSFRWNWLKPGAWYVGLHDSGAEPLTVQAGASDVRLVAQSPR